MAHRATLLVATPMRSALSLTNGQRAGGTWRSFRMGAPVVGHEVHRLGPVVGVCGAWVRRRLRLLEICVVAFVPAEGCGLDAERSQSQCAAATASGAPLNSIATSIGERPCSRPKSWIPSGWIEMSSSRSGRPRSFDATRQAPVPSWYVARGNSVLTQAARLRSAASLTATKKLSAPPRWSAAAAAAAAVSPPRHWR